MEQNQIYQNVKCLDLNTDFVGTTMIEGKKVFIEKFLPSERADIKITEIKSKFIRGQVERLLEASPMRKHSLVEQYPNSTFGGCDLQIINYQAQLQIKKQLTEKIAKLQDREHQYIFEDVIAASDELHYRNKMYYPLYCDELTREIKAGFYRKGSREIIDATDNFLAQSQISQMLERVVHQLNERHVKIANYQKEKQGLKGVMLRYSETTKGMMLIFIATTKAVKGIERVAKDLQREHKWIKSVYLNINGKNQGHILGEKTILLAGQQTITAEMLGLTFAMTPQAFYQVNERQTAMIYQQVRAWLSNHQKATVLDFYSGIGTMSLLVADNVKEVIGIDIVDEAISIAEENAKLNDITNVSFVVADVAHFIKAYQKDNEELIAIIDPPRSGCSRTFITDLVALQPEQIIYLSCNPKTLVRDLQLFREMGYEHGKIKLYDMFPQTLHVESAVLLTKGSKGV